MSSSNEFASPPCLAGEFEDYVLGESKAGSDVPDDIDAWRKAVRQAIFRARDVLPSSEKAELDTQIGARLEKAIGAVDGQVISLYWPIRGEPDLRPLIPRFIERGATCVLPVVVERDQPLVFRTWAPGEPLERGIWNIPVPARGAEAEPAVLVAPVVAFDRACFRLGNGGGYFDRTLAVLSGEPRVFGAGYANAEIATIHPQAHDLPMSAIVTEAELICR